MKPNRLFGNRCYLAGAIDRHPDLGQGWREEITPVLQSIGVLVLNPMNKPIDVPGDDPGGRESRRIMKQNEDYESLAAYVKKLRQVDLRLVDISDFLIVSIDTSVYACGTFEELFWANRQKKPVLVWSQGGKKDAPDWLFGTIPHQHIFGSVPDLMNYLIYVDSGEHPDTLGRWVFFDYNKVV